MKYWLRMYAHLGFKIDAVVTLGVSIALSLANVELAIALNQHIMLMMVVWAATLLLLWGLRTGFAWRRIALKWKENALQRTIRRYTLLVERRYAKALVRVFYTSAAVMVVAVIGFSWMHPELSHGPSPTPANYAVLFTFCVSTLARWAELRIELWKAHLFHDFYPSKWPRSYTI